jgi:hypothetical protein
MSTPSACLRFSGSCPVSATSTFRANATQRNTTQRNATFAVSLKNMPPAPVPHPTLPRPSSSLPPRLASLSFSPAPAVVLVFVYCCLLSSVFCLLSSVSRLPSLPAPAPAPPPLAPVIYPNAPRCPQAPLLLHTPRHAHLRPFNSIRQRVSLPQPFLHIVFFYDVRLPPPPRACFVYHIK